MRKILVGVFLCLFCLQASAQTPEKISYQAVVRDNANALVADKVVGIRISILQGSVTGTPAYVETQSPRSNVNGLVTLEIGAGTVVSGSFVGLNWSAGPYFIQTEIDPSGGSNYSILGVSQLVSVPYALYAKTSGSSTPGPAGPAGVIGAIGPQGPAGANGTNGLAGPAGPQGPIGLTGIAGAAGANGTVGAVGPQGAKGDTGDTGATGPIGPAGANGTNGLAGPAGPQGPIGFTGIAGAAGPQGMKGDTGLIGLQGIQGEQGFIGSKGDQGATGLTGAKGDPGDQGQKGDTGAQGLAGANNGITYTVTNSGSSAYLINGASNPPLTVIRGMTYIFQINAAGHPFWLQTTSGSYNASNIYSTGVTDNGEAVGAISWQVPFDAPNTVYYVCQFHSSMNGQINVSDAGPVGPQGVKGDVGEQGIQGLTGVAGLVGATGKSFYQIGLDNGFVGTELEFIISFVGDKGDIGNTGDKGIQGDKGDKGDQGIQGAKGDTGAIGPVGPTGLIGPQGIQGEQGFIGSKGDQGATGLTGAKGDPGDQGQKGDTGAQGPAGANNGITYTVTNAGSGAYLINGASNPPLTVIRGMTYIFQINAAGHPFWLQTTSGSYNASNIYSTGATDNGKAVGTITWQVPFDAPNTVYYVCQLHSSMNGQINVSDAGPVGPQGAKGEVGEQGIQGFTGVAGPAPSGTGIVTVVSGTLQTPSGLTGDVTTTGAGLATIIGTGAVTSGKILDGTIATTDLANSAVTDEKIAGVAGSKVSGNITGNAANVTGTVAVVNGGTGATTLTGLVKGNGTDAMTAAVAGTDYQAPLVLTTTTGSGVATLSGATLNIPTLADGTAAGDMLYWNGSAWVKVSAGSNGQTLSIVGTTPMWQKPAIPSMGTTDVYNHKTGKVWMDRNLGASQVATSSTDVASYGDLYQWGRGADGHQNRTPLSAITTGQSSSSSPGANFLIGSSNWYNGTNPDNLWQGVSGVNNPCPSGYRIPTEAEWEAERLSWTGGNNAAGALASTLKLPLAGVRLNSDGLLLNVGTSGLYWSSTVSSSNATSLYISSFASMNTNNRADGLSVRCLKN